MDLIGSSIDRLHDNLRKFISPPTARQDIELLKTQIELRRLALRDIEIIRFRLRPFIGRRCEGRQRRLRVRRLGTPRSDAGRVGILD